MFLNKILEENMANKILNMELSEDDASLLRESLVAWKEEVYAQLLEDVSELKTQKIEELEEANRQYQSELKEDYSNKMIEALNEMREDLRAEVLSETIAANPELQVLERIKELVAPTLNEDYIGNVYAEQIQTLREENEMLVREIELEEGAETLAELIAPYSSRTQNIILSLIKEGNAEDVTEQFYDLIESLEEAAKDEDKDEDEDEDEEEDDKKKKKSKSKKDDDDDEDEDDDDDEDEDDEDEDDDDLDEDFDDSFINEEENWTSRKKVNSRINEITRLVN
jgi:hypothetical protein